VNAFITQVGASNVGNKIEAAWKSSHATTAYATATLYTLRRFNSVKKLLISAPGIYEADFPTNEQDVDLGLFGREISDDFLEARIAAERVPEGQQF